MTFHFSPLSRLDFAKIEIAPLRAHTSAPLYWWLTRDVWCAWICTLYCILHANIRYVIECNNWIDSDNYISNESCYTGVLYERLQYVELIMVLYWFKMHTCSFRLLLLTVRFGDNIVNYRCLIYRFNFKIEKKKAAKELAKGFLSDSWPLLKKY